MLCILICSLIGLHAFFHNRGSYRNVFSTFIRATNDSELRAQIQAGDKGSDPLQKALRRSVALLGGRDNLVDSYHGHIGAQDVEDRLLHRKSSEGPPRVDYTPVENSFTTEMRSSIGDTGR